MACCGNCAQGAPCASLGSSLTQRNPTLGAISTASVAGLPIVATLGGVGGALVGLKGAKMLGARGTIGKGAGLVLGAIVGWRALPSVTDAVGI